MSESAGVAGKSSKAQSAKNAGPVTRKEQKNEPLPEELLEILADHFKKIEHSGIHVKVIPVLPEKMGQGVGFLVMGVEIVEGKLRRIQEPE